MAGTDAGFPKGEFIDAIRFAMTMGLAVALEDRPAFWRKRPRDYESESLSGSPWNFTDVPVAPGDGADPLSDIGPIRVPCAIETSGEVNAGAGTAVGQLNADEVLLTFVQPDWVKVDGFDYVLINQDRYDYVKRIPDRALFNAGVVQVLVQAHDVN